MKINVNSAEVIKPYAHSNALNTANKDTPNTNHPDNSVDDDHVTLSSTKLINFKDNLRDHDQEAVSKQRVERIRVAIEDGTYVTDPFRTAVKIMEFDRLFQ